MLAQVVRHEGKALGITARGQDGMLRSLSIYPRPWAGEFAPKQKMNADLSALNGSLPDTNMHKYAQPDRHTALGHQGVGPSWHTR